MHLQKIFPIPKLISRLDVVVVHGGDNFLRAIATAIGVIRETIFEKHEKSLYLLGDKVIIFSGAKTSGQDHPSEARNMYHIFQQHIHSLNDSGDILHGIFIPNRTTELKQWNIRVGKQNILICIESRSVDTEDNAERSMQIISELLQKGTYDTVSASPLSSDFHTKRIQEAFKRYFPEGFITLTDSLHLPLSAEKILKNAGGIYARYGIRKEQSISNRSKIREYVICIVSRFAWGRRKIRSITCKRVLE